MIGVQQEVNLAEKRIRPYIRQTPLDFSIPLSRITGSNVYLKCENLQYTNAFKVRGAFNKLLSLTPTQRKQGVVTASSGNHGAAVAFGSSQLKIPSLIFVPNHAAVTKIENIRNYNAPLKFHGDDTMDTEAFALEYAQKNNKIYISPYNDPQVIGGQGTIALELVHQLKEIDIVLVPIGGGGLISGIAGYLKAVSPETKIIGCLPETSPVMAESIKAGKIIEMETFPSLSDATAGGIEPGSITFELCKKFVDDYILVSEEEIKNAIISAIKTHHLLIEGASGVAFAAPLKNAARFQRKKVVVILSGGNIGLDTLKKVLLSDE